MNFDEALQAWEVAATALIDQRLSYESTYAQALIDATGKSAEIRKAQADIAALDALRQYEHAEIRARALEHQLLFLRGATVNHEDTETTPGRRRGFSRKRNEAQQ